MGQKTDYGILKDTLGDSGITSIGNGNALNTTIGTKVLETDIFSAISNLPIISNLKDVNGIQEVMSKPINGKSHVKAEGIAETIGLNKPINGVIKF